MRWPWSPSEKEIDEVADERVDDELDYEDDEAGEDEEVSLDDFDDETRAKVERLQAKEREASDQRVATMRSIWQEQGLDITPDGKAVVADPNRFAGWMGGTGSPAPAAAAAGEPEPEEMPDPYDDKPGYQAWLKAQIRAEAKRMHDEDMKPILEAQQQQQQIFYSRETERALQTLPQALQQYNPMLTQVTEHPDFAGQFSQALQAIPLSQWREPVNLAQIAGVVATQLDYSKVSKQRPRSQQTGRYQAGFAAVAPSRGSAGRDAELADEQAIRGLVERHGGTRDEWEALAQDDSIDGYRAAKSKAQARGKR